MRLLLLFSLFHFCISCQSHKFRAKPDLIFSYSKANQSLEPFKAPYVTTYTKDKKTLKFIAAAHSNQVESDTFKTILDVINSFNPQILILEGFENKKEVSPNWYMEHAQKCHIENYLKCGEAEYAGFVVGYAGSA